MFFFHPILKSVCGMRKKKYTLALGLSRELKRPWCPETIIGPHHLLDNPSLKPYLKITHKILYSGECVRACASVCESACVPFPRVCVRALRWGDASLSFLLSPCRWDDWFWSMGALPSLHVISRPADPRGPSITFPAQQPPEPLGPMTHITHWLCQRHSLF